MNELTMPVGFNTIQYMYKINTEKQINYADHILLYQICKKTQQAKRQYWYKSQQDQLYIKEEEPRKVWENIGQTRVGNEG